MAWSGRPPEDLGPPSRQSLVRSGAGRTRTAHHTARLGGRGRGQRLAVLLQPQVVEPAAALHIGDPYKAKCIGIHWEFMFARSRFQTGDMICQHRILARVGSLVEAGRLRTTLSEVLGPIDAANLREAHRRLESGTTIGKLALAGWGD